MSNLPEEFRIRMLSLLGDLYEEYLASMDEVPVRSLMLNTMRGVSKDSLPFELSDAPVAWEPDGYYYEMTDEQRPGKHVLHEAGAYYIQEASAMAPARALMNGFDDPEESPYILDLCAAPGGKSTQIGVALNGRGLLVSNEIHPARAQILSKNIERMGIANAVVTNESPAHLADAFPGFFDGILVDAPCSGEGMFRKNPEALVEWSAGNVKMCAERQAEILECAYLMLSPGGRMVYSTCTFSKEEDEDIAAAFLKAHVDMRLIEEKKLMPHEVRGEGQYYAVMEKDGERMPHRQASVRSLSGVTDGGTGSRKKTRKGTGPDNNAEIPVTGMLEELLGKPIEEAIAPGGRMRRIKDSIYYVPAGVSGFLGGLRVLRPGLHIADIKNGRTEPAHALSHALKPYDAVSTVRLSEADAGKFVEGLSISSENLLPADEGAAGAADNSLKQGYALVTYEGISLGWGKLTGGTLKNHYPKGLRTIL